MQTRQGKPTGTSKMDHRLRDEGSQKMDWEKMSILCPGLIPCKHFSDGLESQ